MTKSNSIGVSPVAIVATYLALKPGRVYRASEILS
jgi:hypothetical protein